MKRARSTSVNVRIIKFVHIESLIPLIPPSPSEGHNASRLIRYEQGRMHNGDDIEKELH